MTIVDNLGRLKDIRDQQKFNSLPQAANFCLLHWPEYEPDFIRFCERYLERMEDYC